MNIQTETLNRPLTELSTAITASEFVSNSRQTPKKNSKKVAKTQQSLQVPETPVLETLSDEDQVFLDFACF